MRLNLHDLPRHLQDQASAQLHGKANTVPSGLRHPVPQSDVRQESLVVDPDKEGGAKRITVRLTRFGAKLLDPDNLAGGCKPLLDAIRYEGRIPEDNPAAIRLEVHQTKAPKEKRGTLIEIFYP